MPVNIETSDQILLPPEETEEDVSVEARTLRLRLMEAGIYRDHLRLLRQTWAYRATIGGVVALLAFAVALWPYLGGGGHFRLPIAISYVAAFVFVLAVVFAFVSAYRAIVAASLVSRATFKIKRAEAVQAVFGIPMREQV